MDETCVHYPDATCETGCDCLCDGCAAKRATRDVAQLELVPLERGRAQAVRNGTGLALLRWSGDRMLLEDADQHVLGVLYRSDGRWQTGADGTRSIVYTWRAYLADPVGRATKELVRGADQAAAVTAILAAVQHVTAGHPVDPPCACGECLYRRRLFRSELESADVDREPRNVRAEREEDMRRRAAADYDALLLPEPERIEPDGAWPWYAADDAREVEQSADFHRAYVRANSPGYPATS